jgi:WD40 repeat protein
VLGLRTNQSLLQILPSGKGGKKMKTSRMVIFLVVLILGCLMFFRSPVPAVSPVEPTAVLTPPGKGAISALSTNESGEMIAIGRFDGTSALLDRQGKVLHRWSSPKGSWVTVNAINSHLGLVVSSSGSDEISVLQASDYQAIATQQLGYSVSALAFHPKEQMMVIGTDVLRDKEGLVRSYDFEKKQWIEYLDTKKIPGIEINIPGVYGLEFTPDGDHLAVLTRSTLLLIDRKTNKIARTISQQGSQLFQSMRFSRDGKHLVLSDHNRTFWIYDTASWEGESFTIPDDYQMGRFCLSRDNKYLCATINTPSGRTGGRWAVYSFPKVEKIAYVAGHEDIITRIVADPKGNNIFTAAGDGKVLLWSLDEILKQK